MRPKLDGDVLLSNGLLYLLLTCYVAIIYVGVVGIGTLPFEDPRTVEFRPPWWLNLIALLAVAVTLLPVRRWLQRNINTLVYGQHDDPYALISQVNRQLQTMASPQMTLPAVAEAIASALKLPYVALTTHNAPTPSQIRFGSPPPRAVLTTLPLVYLDQAMGELHVASRRANEALSESDLELLRDVARQVGLALHAAQLTADLQASRERLVIAREEERRRIRNDLHDGLAPTLSALQLQLGAMRTLIRQDPGQAEAIAHELREDLRSATAEIRQLVYDLRPPMLDELGLAGAIRSFSFQGSQVSFEVEVPEPMPTLAAAVEVAVYRIAIEAIHNVVKHAQATACVVRIDVGDGQLKLSVTDNGASLPNEYSAGVGLNSMKERAAELGGTLSIQPGEADGTQVVVQFPIDV